MLKKSLIQFTIFSLSTPVFALDTSVIETQCKWLSREGEKIIQKCKISGVDNEDGKQIKITWEDGYLTKIRNLEGTSTYLTPSGTKAYLEGTYLFDYFHFPRRISLEGLGSVDISYSNFVVRNHDMSINYGDEYYPYVPTGCRFISQLGVGYEPDYFFVQPCSRTGDTWIQQLNVLETGTPGIISVPKTELIESRTIDASFWCRNVNTPRSATCTRHGWKPSS